MMSIETGTEVRIRTQDGSVSVAGTVRERDSRGRYTLLLEEKVDGLVGQRLVLITDSGSYHVTADHVEDDGTIVVVPSGEERRAFFRVDDVIPVRIRRTIPSRIGSARFISPPITLEEMELSDEESVDSPLMSVLKEINTKLDFLINTLMMKNEGLTFEEQIPVNISATGMRFDFEEEVQVGDIMEMKMVLPTYPPVAILTYGEVVRVREVDRDGVKVYETAVKFTDMSEEVREEIIQYTLKRQREVLKKRWEET